MTLEEVLTMRQQETHAWYRHVHELPAGCSICSVDQIYRDSV